MTPEEALLLWLRRAYERGQLTVRLERHIRAGKISLSEAVAALDRVLEESDMIEAPSVIATTLNDQPHEQLEGKRLSKTITVVKGPRAEWDGNDVVLRLF